MGDGHVTRNTLPDVIEIERLLLRPWELGDISDVFSYA
jgi:hypothetical protein